MRYLILSPKAEVRWLWFNSMNLIQSVCLALPTPICFFNTHTHTQTSIRHTSPPCAHWQTAPLLKSDLQSALNTPCNSQKHTGLCFWPVFPFVWNAQKPASPCYDRCSRKADHISVVQSLTTHGPFYVFEHSDVTACLSRLISLM